MFVAEHKHVKGALVTNVNGAAIDLRN